MSDSIVKSNVDFDALRESASLFLGRSGLDAEIRFYADGRVRIKQYTTPRHETVQREVTRKIAAGERTQLVRETRQVRVGSRIREETRRIVIGHRTETYTATIPLFENREVERKRLVPAYETRPVSRTRWARVLKPYSEASREGEYVWEVEEYETEEDVVVGHMEETYTVHERAQVGERQEERTREVPVYGTEACAVEVPVYDARVVATKRTVPVFKEQPGRERVRKFVAPKLVDTTVVDLTAGPGTIFIDGRITRLEGDLRGRLTIVGNEKVRIAGSIRYVDDEGRPAMKHGGDFTRPYESNPDYDGDSILGVIARGDIVLTAGLPQQSELNAMLHSAEGRVVIDGFRIDADGAPDKDYLAGLPKAGQQREEAYNRTNYRVMRFRRESLRLMGSIAASGRVLDTFMRVRGDGTAYVESGFKRGSSHFDTNLIHRPPPHFRRVPGPDAPAGDPVTLVPEGAR